MKQIFFCDHFLNVKSSILTDVTVNVFDCISPQKTTIEIKLNYDIGNSDIIVIRDHKTLKTEYIGIIDAITNTTVTEIAMFPFINIFDCECLMSSLDGSVFDWLSETINRNFVDTGDELNDYPIEVVNGMTNDYTYKQIVDSKNMFDILTEIFLNNGIYLQFELGYDTLGRFNKIIARVLNANEQDLVKFRYDNPQIVDGNVSIENSHTSSYNKAIVVIEDANGNKGNPIFIYLRDDNTLTSNPHDSKRIKQVKPKIIEYKPSKDEVTPDQQSEAIIVLAQKALCGNAFDHSIEFTVVRSGSIDWKYYRRCDFLAEDRVYNTYISKVEYLSDKHAKITLGAYRYTLTDKFKSLKRDTNVIEDVGLNGVSVSPKFDKEIYWFEQDSAGNLVLHYPDGTTPPDYYIDASGNLIVEYDENKGQPVLNVDTDGDLVYTVE